MLGGKYQGLESGGRETSQFIRRIKTSLTSEQIGLITGASPIPDPEQYEARISSLTTTTQQHENKVIAGENTTKAQRRNYKEASDMLQNLHKKQKVDRTRMELMTAAADAALKFIRENSTESVHTILTEFDQHSENRMIQVRKVLAYMQTNWSGNPTQTRKEIDAALNALPAATTKPGLAKLLTKAEALRQEQKLHFDENPGAFARQLIIAPMTDVGFILFLRERVSNLSPELGRVRDYLDRRKIVPPTLAAVRTRIVQECQWNVTTVDEEMPAPRPVQQRSLATAAAAATISADEIAYLQAEEAQEANNLFVHHASAAIGMDGAGTYVSAPSRGSQVPYGGGYDASPSGGWRQQQGYHGHYSGGVGFTGYPGGGGSYNAGRGGANVNGFPQVCTFWDGQRCTYAGTCSRSHTHTPGVDQRPTRVKIAAQFQSTKQEYDDRNKRPRLEPQL